MIFWLRIWGQLKEFPYTRGIAATAWCEGVLVGIFLSWLVVVWLR